MENKILYYLCGEQILKENKSKIKILMIIQGILSLLMLIITVVCLIIIIIFFMLNYLIKKLR